MCRIYRVGRSDSSGLQLRDKRNNINQIYTSNIKYMTYYTEQNDLKSLRQGVNVIW